MIEVKNLTKKYGDVLAVDNLSFTIEPGKIYGFLGPNGAGKSTTMNIMTGCLAATSGEVKIGGFDIFEEPIKAKKLIGYLPEIPPLYMDQTPYEYLDFVASAKGLKKAERLADIQRVIEETHIEGVANRIIKKLSKGYKQRVGIAQALLGNPEVIILDEPTVGLDPAQIIEIRELIKNLGENHTVILSSHILSEVQYICDMVLIINEGRLVAFDTTEGISESIHGDSGNSAIELVCEGDADAINSALEACTCVTNVAIKSAEAETVTALITIEGNDTKSASKEIIANLVTSDIALVSITPVKTSLEDAFIELTSEKENSLGTASEFMAGLATETEDEDGEEDPEEASEEDDQDESSMGISLDDIISGTVTGEGAKEFKPIDSREKKEEEGEN